MQHPQIILEQYIEAFEEDFGRQPEPTAYLATAELYRMGECGEDDFPSYFEPEELVKFTKWCLDRVKAKNQGAGVQSHNYRVL